jgi:hypothetical protein
MLILDSMGINWLPQQVPFGMPWFSHSTSTKSAIAIISKPLQQSQKLSQFVQGDMSMLIQHLYQMGDELLVVVQIHAFPQFCGAAAGFRCSRSRGWPRVDRLFDQRT